MQGEPVLSLEVRRIRETHSGVTEWEVEMRMTLKTESAADAAGAVLDSLRDLLEG
jgi:hypothetical protein